MAGVIPPLYNHADLSNFTFGRRTFILTVRDVEESFDVSTTAEEVQEAMAGVFEPAAIFNPDVALLASAFIWLNIKMNKHGARLGTSSTHLPSSLLTPTLLAKWLFEPGEEIDTANTLEMMAVSMRSTSAWSAVGPLSSNGSAPAASLNGRNLTADRCAHKVAARFRDAKASSWASRRRCDRRLWPSTSPWPVIMG